MTNRYRGVCVVCCKKVQARAGTVTRNRGRWEVRCASCSPEEVHTIRTSGGTFYRNARGRCEDAPCCGCCTI